MKKLIIAALLLMPMMGVAQSEWQVPQTPEQKAEAAKQAEKAAKKAEKEAKKAEKKAAKEAKELADAKAKNQQRIKEAQAEIERKNTEQRGIFDKKSKSDIVNDILAEKNGTKKEQPSQLKCDAKYLDGAISYNAQNKIEWQTEIKAPGKSADEVYDLVFKFLDRLTSGNDQIKGSRVALVNKQDHKIVATVKEWLVFTSSALSLDRTKIDYAIIAECHDGKAKITINNISYKYEEDRSTGINVKAEEWIDDENGMNKKHTNVSRMSGKFRKKTIDRKDQLFQAISDLLNS